MSTVEPADTRTDRNQTLTTIVEALVLIWCGPRAA